jgi:hypothetical protein
MNKRLIRYTLVYTLGIFIFIPWSFTALADAFQEAPYDFLFGNHIDTHQETKLKLKPVQIPELMMMNSQCNGTRKRPANWKIMRKLKMKI